MRASKAPAADGSGRVSGRERGVLAGRRVPVPLNGRFIQYGDDEFVQEGRWESVTCKNEILPFSRSHSHSDLSGFQRCI